MRESEEETDVEIETTSETKGGLNRNKRNIPKKILLLLFFRKKRRILTKLMERKKRSNVHGTTGTAYTATFGESLLLLD